MIRRNRYLRILQHITRASISKQELAAAMLATECASPQAALKTVQRAFRSSKGLQEMLALLGYRKEQKQLTIAQALVMNAYLGGDADHRIYEALCAFIETKYPSIIDECKRV